MTIQAAIKACLAKENRFGRPTSWKGSGSAIDLARRLDKNRARCLVSLNAPHNLLGSDWNVNPEDFLSDWEVVSAEDLANEACQMGELDV